MRTMLRTRLYVLAGLIALGACVCPGLIAIPALPDEPAVANAQLETRAVAGSLIATLQLLVQESAQPLWIAYSVEKIAGEQSICCGDRGDDDALGCGTCALENERNNWSERGAREKLSTWRVAASSLCFCAPRKSRSCGSGWPPLAARSTPAVCGSCG